MIENKVYAAIILRLEELEHKGAYNGNAHHLAQDLAKMVSIELLSKQQRFIYDNLDDGRFCAVDAKYLDYATGLGTKNISSQIQQIQKKTNLIGIIKNGKNFKYYKL
ncbi:hypothetical protein [Sphingobacterium yanglingense]|uniref:Uncharacterized protein n=1 Tax=Sphingobacterium yanglingense TaxID=1437280 RepID=A0A4R6WH92_9SPHI|nr:hypothetical protein [Sphingobacterium yanglingense]TDQ79543.1 hypothetical protein CLV99_0986 [Sphingobacterium yanglingense]